VRFRTAVGEVAISRRRQIGLHLYPLHLDPTKFFLTDSSCSSSR
jgi:hypothetical protein